MFRFAVLLTCFALIRSHAVLPVVVPHGLHAASIAVSYPLHHGYGYASHGLPGHGPLGHHILKRSPHYAASLGHVAHVAPIAPVAVSHQSRVDFRTSPVVAAPVFPVVKTVVAPVLPAVPLLHKTLLAAPLPYGVGHYNYNYGGHYAAGHYGSIYPHLTHSHY